MELPYAIDDPEELAHAAGVLGRLEQEELIRKLFDDVSQAPIGSTSQLGLDDAATAPHQLSHYVSMALNMATDNMRAVHAMLVPEDHLLVPLYAHYPVLRSILEASAVAKWILEPENRVERITRLLRARVFDIRQDAELSKIEIDTVEAMADPSSLDEIREARRANNTRRARDLEVARGLAQENGIPWAAVKSGLPPYIHIIRAVCIVPAGTDSIGVPGGYAASVWKILSGLSHPSASRTAQHSVLEPLSEADNGVVHARITPSVARTEQAMTVAFNTAFEAITLFAQRRLGILESRP